MRIGIDARLYSETGIGRYISNLLSELKIIDKKNEYTVFLSNGNFNAFTLAGNRWQKVLLDIPWHSMSEQLQIPPILHKYRFDLFHFPYFNVPVFYSGKFTLTVHDLIIDHFPTGRASTHSPFLYYLKRFAYKQVLSSALKRASAVFAISGATKKEIIDHYRIPAAKISITPNALDRRLKITKQRALPGRLIKSDYLLYVGNAYPHKNLEMLLDVFSDSEISGRVKLVMTGDDNYFYPRLKKEVTGRRLDRSVVFFGHAPERQLASLYSHAVGLITPSLMEGFGLPNMEAVSYGCLPVVSDIPVFREIWGPDFLYFDPHSSVSAKKAILELLGLTGSARLKKIKNARKKLAFYSWKVTAGATLRQWEEIVLK